jgi:hypothetical protein
MCRACYGLQSCLLHITLFLGHYRDWLLPTTSPTAGQLLTTHHTVEPIKGSFSQKIYAVGTPQPFTAAIDRERLAPPIMTTPTPVVFRLGNNKPLTKSICVALRLVIALPKSNHKSHHAHSLSSR